MRLLGQVGSFSSVSFDQAAGSSPLSLAVPSRLWMAAARRQACSEPQGRWRGEVSDPMSDRTELFSARATPAHRKMRQQS
jgi:hypothetical protein